LSTQAESLLHVAVGNANHICWRCNAGCNVPFFCPHCHAVQPLFGDPFICLGFPYRLNVDASLLSARFHVLSRKFHPDFYQRNTPEEQAISLVNAARVNVAYRTLKDPQKRIECLIHLVEGDSTIPTEAPADLFEAIFEMEEALDAIRTTGTEAMAHPYREALRKAQEKFAARLQGVHNTLSALSTVWDGMLDESTGVGGTIWTEQQRGVVMQMKQALSHLAYLERILKNVAVALEPAVSR